jgi:hypothetical protein
VKIIKLIGYKDRVWLFPGFYDQPLLVYDYKDDSIIIDSRYEKVKELCQRKKNSNSAYGACVLAGDCVWAPILETNEVVGINLEDGEVSGVRLSKKTSRLITCSQNVLWVLSDRGSTLIRYDLVTKEERCFGFKEPVSDKTETLYRSLVSYEEFLYIMPLKADVLIVFDKERLSFTYINISMYKHEKEVDFSHLSGLPHQGGITLFPINHCELLQVEYRNEKWCIEQQALQIEPDELNRLFMEKDDQVYQSPNYPLNTFVDRVSNSMISNAGKDNLEFTKHLKYADGKCGERIWHEVLSALLLAQ